MARLEVLGLDSGRLELGPAGGQGGSAAIVPLATSRSIAVRAR